ncbi:unnamed protein product [Trifolium pratense]|uniref:Uncharacterized protein n=1 Tax=Trifolium pratense TaxID=57577 RepID=A0ACB0KLN2_TRIPR|nr:unnamed protein product [Trifolium pratense]
MRMEKICTESANLEDQAAIPSRHDQSNAPRCCLEIKSKKPINRALVSHILFIPVFEKLL